MANLNVAQNSSIKNGQFCMLPLSIILNIVLCGLYFKGINWGNINHNLEFDLSWSRKAAEEAEEVASIPCSGHGSAFLDGLIVVDDYGVEKPVCECYACYTGPHCSLLSLPCLADANGGNPYFMEPFWRKQKESSGVLVSGCHRIGYSTPAEFDLGIMPIELKKYIRKLHEMVGNAVTEGKYIVCGVGSTQLMNAAVHALSSATTNSNSSSTPAFVVASIPFYSAYESQTKYFESAKFEFKGEASKWINKSDGSKVLIEFVTSPNNPDGQLNKAVLKGPSVKTIHDHAYYWPHFTPISAPSDEDLMLFTVSKLTGHAGSRFGWAIVKDKEVYQKMVEYVGISTLGVSHDTQLRVLKLLKAIVEDGGKKIFEFGHTTMRERWTRLNAIISASSRFSLQDVTTPQFCTFYQRVRPPSPAYAWLKCEREEDEDCYQLLKEGGILGRKGPSFGAEDRYVRLSLLKSNDDFDSLLHNLQIFISSESLSHPQLKGARYLQG